MRIELTVTDKSALNPVMRVLAENGFWVKLQAHQNPQAIMPDTEPNMIIAEKPDDQGEET